MDWLGKVLGFPYEQIGEGLRGLSLSGNIGNVVAIILYIGFGLLPVIVFFILWKTKKLCKWDILLPVISALLFAVMYLLINPGYLELHVPEGRGMVLGGTIHSAWVTYMVLRFVHSFSGGDEKKIYKGFVVVLWAMLIVFLGQIVLEFGYTLPQNILALKEGNHIVHGNGDITYSTDLGLTYVFFGLQSLVRALTFVFHIGITSMGLALMKALAENKYSAKVFVIAEKLVKKSKTYLTISASTQVIFNILQLVFADKLYNISVKITIPVFSIVFFLVVWFVARYIRENQQLKHDNDMFI